jgi:hypothetical protein
MFHAHLQTFAQSHPHSMYKSITATITTSLTQNQGAMPFQ